MKNNFFLKKNKFITLKKIYQILKNNSKTFNKKIYGVNNLIDANKNEITFFNKLSYEHCWLSTVIQRCTGSSIIFSRDNFKYDDST